MWIKTWFYRFLYSDGAIYSTLKFVYGGGRKLFLKKVYAGRRLDVFEDDVFLVSYPKSGNTWLRFLVANLLKKESVTFKTIPNYIPDIYGKTNAELMSYRRPRILKSHEYYDSRYKRLILVVRDPRDVLISYYHYSKKTGRISSDCSLEEFSYDFIGGRVDPYKDWCQHFLGWHSNKKEGILVVRYEDLLSNSIFEVKRIADFLGVSDIENDELMTVIERSSFKAMRENEKKKEGENWSHLKGSSSVPFVRSGVSGGWKDEGLAPDVVKRINEEWGEAMDILGY